MAYTTAGLTNGGRTSHYQIQYDDTLSRADGMDRANALIAACESDFALMSDWFGNIPLTVGMPITVQIAPGPPAGLPQPHQSRPIHLPTECSGYELTQEILWQGLHLEAL